jgi:hypothetical protein
LALVKARARLETATTPIIKLSSDRALDIARANRLDWMNNRALLVDQWRLFAFQANSLRAGLDLTFGGDMGTVGNNPVALNGQNGHLRMGLRFDSPFTRRVERNNYRSVMIQYQQQRRQLYLFQDSVNFTLRTLLRTLAQLDVNLEIQRRAVVIAIRRVDKTREDLNKPPAPVQPGQQVESLGPTVSQNLIFALNDLQSAQNNFVSVVLNHYENRMLLYRELGIMELDDCGMWVDKPLNEADWLTEDDCPMPADVPTEWMQEAGVTQQDVEEYRAKDGEDGFQPDPALAAIGEETRNPRNLLRAARSGDSKSQSRASQAAVRETRRPERPVMSPADSKSDAGPKWLPAGSRESSEDPLPVERSGKSELTAAVVVERDEPVEKQPATPSGLILRR